MSEVREQLVCKLADILRKLSNVTVHILGHDPFNNLSYFRFEQRSLSANNDLVIIVLKRDSQKEMLERKKLGKLTTNVI